MAAGQLARLRLQHPGAAEAGRAAGRCSAGDPDQGAAGRLLAPAGRRRALIRPLRHVDLRAGWTDLRPCPHPVHRGRDLDVDAVREDDRRRLGRARSGGQAPPDHRQSLERLRRPRDVDRGRVQPVARIGRPEHVHPHLGRRRGRRQGPLRLRLGRQLHALLRAGQRREQLRRQREHRPVHQRARSADRPVPREGERGTARERRGRLRQPSVHGCGELGGSAPISCGRTTGRSPASTTIRPASATTSQAPPATRFSTRSRR